MILADKAPCIYMIRGAKYRGTRRCPTIRGWCIQSGGGSVVSDLDVSRQVVKYKTEVNMAGLNSHEDEVHVKDEELVI